MFKIKKKAEKPKRTVLYNVIEDYSEFDALEMSPCVR